MNRLFILLWRGIIAKKICIKINFYYKKDEIIQSGVKNGLFFWWSVEEWETFEEIFIREAKKELNLDMNTFDYKNIWEYIFDYPERIVHRNLFLIKTNLKEDEFEVLEWAWAKYFGFEDAKKLKFPSPVDKMIDIIKNNILWKQ